MRALALVLAVTAYPALAEPYRTLPRYTPETVRPRVAGSRAAQRVHSQAPVVPVAATEPAAPAEVEEPVHVVAIPPQPEPLGPANRARRGASPSPPPPPIVAAAAKPVPAAPPRAPMEQGGALSAARVPAPAAPAAIAPAAALPAPAKLADLKVTVGQAGADGGFVMLVEDPSGARIELTLDGGGRLLSVRRAGALGLARARAGEAD